MAGPGVSATGVVLKGVSRTVTIRVPLVAYHPDGQRAYEVVAAAVLMLPPGEDHPRFSVDESVGIVMTEEPR